MKKLSTKVLSSVLMIAMMTILFGCGKNTANSTAAAASESTPKSAMEDFMKFRKSGELDKLKDLIAENYLAAQGLKTDEYVKNLENFDFKNSYKVLDYKVSEVEDVKDNVKKVNVITKYSDSNNTNASLDEDYALLNENGKWKVSPLGVIDSYTCEYSDKESIEAAGKLNMYVDKLINTIDGKILSIKVNNKSEYDFSLGWVDPAKVIVDTDKGQYVQNLDGTGKITRGMNDKFIVKIPGLEGNLKKVVITPVHVLNNGLPNPTDSGEEIVIYQGK